MTVCLPDCACLVFGSCTGTLKLQDVTFQGGTIVCSGGSCQAMFNDTVFNRCSLVVLGAAQATLSRPVFRNMSVSVSGLSMFVHGVSAKVAVQGGTVTGGTQGVTVQAGAHLELTGLSITEVDTVGVELKDEGSCLRLTGCNLCGFSHIHRGGHFVRGVHVHSSSSAHFSSLFVSGMHGVGVCVATHASSTVVDCNVSDSFEACVHIRGGGTSHLNSCSLSDCSSSAGLTVEEAGSSADATKCRFLENGWGARAYRRGTLTAVSCTSVGNRNQGSASSSIGCVVDLTDCASDQDQYGCQAEYGGKLMATRVEVSSSMDAGFRVDRQGELVLHDCSAKQCGRNGVHASDGGSKAHVEGCTFL